jgi:hypothetical protein
MGERRLHRCTRLPRLPRSRRVINGLLHQRLVFYIPMYSIHHIRGF